MKTSISTCVRGIRFLASALLALTGSVSLGFAQEATAVQPPARPSTRGAKSPTDPTDTDSRLKRLVTIRKTNITVEKALAALTERTGIKFTANGGELRVTPIGFRFDSTPIKDAMDSLAHIGMWEWRPNKEHGWVLGNRFDPHALDIVRPRNEAQANVYRLGRKFLDQFAALSAQDQNALTFNPDALVTGKRNSLPFTGLPSDMQDTVRGMLASTIDGADPLQKLPLTADDLPTSRIDLQPHDPQEGFQSFDVDVSSDHTVSAGLRAGMGLSFNVFRDTRDGYQPVPLSEIGARPYYDAAEAAASRQSALATDPRMNAPVTLSLQDATFSQALQQLSLTTGIKYAAFDCYTDEKPARHSLTYDKVPLKDVISDLEAKYPMLYMRVTSHYSWGQTRSGIFVFHRDDDLPKEH